MDGTSPVVNDTNDVVSDTNNVANDIINVVYYSNHVVIDTNHVVLDTSHVVNANGQCSSLFICSVVKPTANTEPGVVSVASEQRERDKRKFAHCHDLLRRVSATVPA